MIRALGNHYGFDVEDPWQELPEKVREVILYGCGREKIKLKLPHERGSGKVRPFEGIIRNMERRYRETESNTVREELARYISHQPCPACGGTRLNEAARHVFVADRNLPDLAALPVGRGPALLRRPGAAGQARRDRRQGRQGDRPAAAVPGRRGPGLPDPGPQRRDPLRRRGPAHPPGQPDRRRPGGRHVHPGRALHRPAPARQRPPAATPSPTCATWATR